MIVIGDCLEYLNSYHTSRYDLVFLDPPFNAGKDYGNGFNDDKPLEDYYRWLRDILRSCARCVKPGGHLLVMNSTRHIGACQVELNKLPHLDYQNTIVWAYTNPTPAKWNLPKSWRPILWYTKGAMGCFNPASDPLDRATLYYNPDRQTAPFLHDLWTDIPKLVGGFLAQEELLTTLDGRFAHPAQFPERLARRILNVFTKPGDLVLDPFAGSGTLPVMAEHMGRRWVAVEQNPEYAKLIYQRLEKPYQRVLTSQEVENGGE